MNHFLVCTVKENKKYFAFTVTVSESENLVSVFERYKGLITVNFTETKKRAKEIADLWNESFKKNGTYLYSPVAKKPYSLSYNSRYGYSMEFDEEITNRLTKAIKSCDLAEEEFDEIFLSMNINGSGLIDEYGTDAIYFARWFGNDEPDEYGEYSEGDKIEFPACVKAKAEEIMKLINNYLEKFGV